MCIMLFQLLYYKLIINIGYLQIIIQTQKGNEYMVYPSVYVQKFEVYI